MSIKIIGAGLPRTGTNTLKVSLVTLGYCEHVYHMKELLVNPERLHYWKTLSDIKDTDWDGMYNGYDGTVDFPGYPWYKEHMKRYPDAKVIAHPECPESLLNYAHHIGSTSSLINFTVQNQGGEFIVLTEPNIIHQMQQKNPTGTFH